MNETLRLLRASAIGGAALAPTPVAGTATASIGASAALAGKAISATTGTAA
jgi:hypothetical protein